MKYQDYYQVMGIERNAAPDDIKKAYRKLARKYHPDVSRESNAEEKFKELGEAYEVLKDPEKRKAYDELGRHQANQEFRPPPNWEQQFGQRAASGSNSDEGVDFSDFFAELFSRRARGQSHTGRESYRMAGQDYEVSVQISLDEAYRGAEVSLQVAMPDYTDEGAVRRTPKTIKTRIPKGVIDGQKLRVPGKGGTGFNGGPNGDLYLTIALKPHPLFRASEHDLYLELPITPWEAALGASIEAPTLDGAVRLKVPKSARAGQKLRLSGKGLPKPGGGQGDFFAVLQIVSPTALSAREEELFEELARVSTFNPRVHFEGK